MVPPLVSIYFWKILNCKISVIHYYLMNAALGLIMFQLSNQWIILNLFLFFINNIEKIEYKTVKLS